MSRTQQVMSAAREISDVAAAGLTPLRVSGDGKFIPPGAVLDDEKEKDIQKGGLRSKWVRVFNYTNDPDISKVEYFPRSQTKSIARDIEHGGYGVINPMKSVISYTARHGRKAVGKQLMGPPALESVTSLKRWYRFTATNTNAATMPVTVGNLLSAMGCLAATTSSVVSMCSSVRIFGIRAWTSPEIATGAATTSLSVFWSNASDINSPDEEKVNSVIPFVTGMGYLSERPPKSSLSSFWWNSNTTSQQLFSLIVPPGSIIDVQLAGRLSNNFGTTATSVAAVASVGKAYYLPLDGVTNHFLQPVGLATIS
jgi:hypothetical protein